MKTPSLFKRATLLLALIAVSSCADGPTQPAAPAIDPGEPSELLGGLLGGLLGAAPDTVVALQRLQPLASPITVSRRMGFFGGTLAIPAAGVSIWLPPGALLRTTTITMTAPAGSTVAYEFGPHGTQFLVPPIITQKLGGVSMAGVSPSNLLAAYFGSLSDIDLATGVSLVTELLNVTVALGGNTVYFPIGHFSGYLIASGHKSEVKTMEPAGAQ